MIIDKLRKAINEGRVCADGLSAVIAVLVFFLGVFFIFDIQLDEGFNVFLRESMGVDDDGFFILRARIVIDRGRLF